MLLKQIEQPLIEPKLGMASASDDAEMENASTMMMPAQGQGGGKRGGGQQVRLLAPSGNPDVFKAVGLILGSPDFQRQ